MKNLMKLFSSKDTFRVKLKGRAGLVYEEDGKKMNVDSEMLSGENYDLVVYCDSIESWDYPFSKGPLSLDERKRILSNIKECLEKHNLKIDIQGTLKE